MSQYRFEVGTNVMCNLGEFGWRLGRIIALNYREETWPQEKVAPYQVALDLDYSLIYVPKDDDRFCRKATDEDVKILSRKDALAELNTGIKSIAGTVASFYAYEIISYPEDWQGVKIFSSKAKHYEKRVVQNSE